MPVTHHASELKTLACNDTSALVSVLVPGLPQTLLVQLAGIDCGPRRRFSLFVIYREGGMTFEAVSAFDVGRSAVALDAVLIQFVRGPEFAEAVLHPIQSSVRRHFRR